MRKYESESPSFLQTNIDRIELVTPRYNILAMYLQYHAHPQSHRIFFWCTTDMEAFTASILLNVLVESFSWDQHSRTRNSAKYRAVIKRGLQACADYIRVNRICWASLRLTWGETATIWRWNWSTRWYRLKSSNQRKWDSCLLHRIDEAYVLVV